MEPVKTAAKVHFKYCIVPKCTNTTVTAPEKHFFIVPQNKKIRDKWCKVMKRRDSLSEKSVKYCCEDHFNVEEDTENFMRHRFIGGRLFLKKNVLPHKFSCQKAKSDVEERSAVAKRRRIEYYSRVLSMEIPVSVAQQEPEFIECISCTDVDMEPNVKIQTKNKSVQVHIKDKSKDKSCQTTFKKKSVAFGAKLNKDDNIRDNITEPSDTSSLSVSFTGSTTTFEEIPENNIDHTLYKIKIHSQLYLGLSQDSYFLIDTLVNNVQLPQIHILITLKKIRLNDSYSRLAIDFGLQKGCVAKVIRKTLPLIAHFMKDLIYFPEKSKVEENLPMAFRSRFSKTQSIIDCFEIQIQQPSNATHQSLTWSNYKGCNTLKYLISITPNGFINYISGGYGGRVDDAALFQDCKIIDQIPTGSTILADRGFKHIASIVESKGCKLIRPPSVKTGAVSNKADVMDTKRIAAVRIHVERSIGRLRSFKMLAPHACVNVKMLPVFDDIVYVACGLVNLQSLSIKQ
ncbi:hypothetical protein ABMA28_016397 [Loxostege sticticalis]|uniref:THAP-type domain-containing protein n=1 Tax=Loxostege sticticalis TaxID=481309 RepID=A0ABD0T8P5_LOXSC